MSGEHETYDTINEFGIVGDFGFMRFEGPWSVEKEGTKWTIVMPYDDMERSAGTHSEGKSAVLIADGKIIGGGIVDAVFDPRDEGEQHVVVDQYARG
jgi:hypothetical protein